MYAKPNHLLNCELRDTKASDHGLEFPLQHPWDDVDICVHQLLLSPFIKKDGVTCFEYQVHT